MKTNIWEKSICTNYSIQKYFRRYYCLNPNEIKKFEYHECYGYLYVFYYFNGYFIEFLTKDHTKYNIFNIIDNYYLFKRKQKQLKKRFIEKTVSTCFLQEIVHDWIWVVKW